MEISAVYPSPPCSICLQSSFSDRSHLLFYSPSPSIKAIYPLNSTFNTRFSSAPSTPVRPRRSLPCVIAACQTCDSIEVEQGLLKELADLKAQMKQKQKLLKAHMKEKKKAKKQKMIKAKGCSSSSSSSSSSSLECRDGEREAVNMKPVRQELPQSRAEGDAQQSRNNSQLVVGGAQGELADGGPTTVAGKIEVCMGGQCRKAGSEQLLSSLRGRIPINSSVKARPCKCMGKCGMAVNVKIQKDKTNSQHHSHVGVDDGSLILTHHFGLGTPPSSLPTFAASSPFWAPLASSATT